MLSTEQWKGAKVGSARTWDFSGANSPEQFGMSGLELVLHGILRGNKVLLLAAGSHSPVGKGWREGRHQM